MDSAGNAYSGVTVLPLPSGRAIALEILERLSASGNLEFGADRNLYVFTQPRNEVSYCGIY